jgi:flagellar protein FlaJ
MELNEKNTILIGIAAMIIVSALAMLMTRSMVIFFNVVIIGTVSIVVPFSLYQFAELKKIKNCEDEFPNFLRDLAEAKRSGLSVVQGIQTCAKSDYGALTPEIVKINNQLSWNIPMRTVLERFRKKFSRSNVINYSILIITQMEESGGKTEDIMDSLADNIENIKETEAEKKVLMNQHIMSMYAIFFIFFGISVALIKFLIPLVSIGYGEGTSSNSLEGTDIMQMIGGNPCQQCAIADEGSCLSCNIFFGVCYTFGFGEASSAGCYYKSLFFLMIIIQGIFSGLVAGQIGSDSLIAGIKHSLIMTVSGFVMFLIASILGLI